MKEKHNAAVIYENVVINSRSLLIEMVIMCTGQANQLWH